jgi:lysozyme
MATKTQLTAGAAIVAACCTFLAPHEGMRTTAYKDPARPTLATICYGETQGVKFGDTKTPEQCRAMLEQRIPDYLGPVDRSVTKPMPDSRRIALTDFAYNVGVTRYLQSGIPAKLNADDVPGGCGLLLHYVYAAGVKMPGLVKRREDEYRLCMQG